MNKTICLPPPITKEVLEKLKAKTRARSVNEAMVFAIIAELKNNKIKY